MESRIEKVMENGFDYEKALVRINRTHDEVNSLRDKVREFGVVPKSIHDKQVIIKHQNEMCYRNSNVKNCFSSCVTYWME